MTIDRLHVENFKSIREVDVEFSDLNVFVGRNAAGKSNLFEVFQFLRDARDVGLNDAVQLQGGIEYLRNKTIRKNNNMKIETGLKSNKKEGEEERGGRGDNSSDKLFLELEFIDNSYNVVADIKSSVSVSKSESDSEVWVASVDQNIGVFSGLKYIKNRFENIEEEHIGSEISNKEHENIESKISESIESKSYNIENKDVELLKSKESLNLGQTYDIQTKKIQQPTTLKGKTELEPDGSNLALVIRNIVEDEEQKEKFVTLVSDVLPFVSDSDVETMPDQSLFLKILEEFEPGEDQYIPASMLSDGTLRVLATIVLLYFSDEETIFIEEPGRNVHPSLIANLMAKIRDVTENTDKQVFITTHNVEVVRNAPLESIRLVSRGDDGFTQVEQPAESERVQTFLENGMGIGELYTENLLGE